MALAVRLGTLNTIVATMLLSTTLHHPVASIAEEVDATKTWEGAIAAMGGRERLNDVRNVVLPVESELYVSLFRRVKTHYETLVVPPARLWDWYDERPSKTELWLVMVASTATTPR